jgi:type I restriction system specificity protein
MNKIQRLLQEHCPNGVEWKTLGEVARLEKGKQLNKTALLEEGAYPAYNGGVSFSGFTNTYNYKENTIIISQGGASAGFVNFVTTKFYANAHCYVILPNTELVENRFVYHLLKSSQEILMSRQLGAGIPALRTSEILGIPIPLPPLPVQQEIVRILDKFTTLEAELEAELEARKKQYEYYKDNLLTFGDEVEWKALGEVGAFVRGSGLQKIDLTTSGIPAIHYGQIYTYYGVSVEQTISFVTPETAKGLKKVDYGDVIITNTSENLEDVGKAVFYSVKEQGVTGGHATIFKPSKEIIGKYLVYYTQTAEFSNQKRKYAKGTKVIDVSANDLAKITVPIPYPNDTKKSLEEQARIVAILDRFDTLVNSISEGLPKEIALRRKQYEYYREQLLSFPKR